MVNFQRHVLTQETVNRLLFTDMIFKVFQRNIAFWQMEELIGRTSTEKTAGWSLASLTRSITRVGVPNSIESCADTLSLAGRVVMNSSEQLGSAPEERIN